MLYYDFESMLEAVCETIGSEVPKLEKPKLTPQPKKPFSKSLPKPEKNDNQDYVPPKAEPTYDRSRQIFNSMQSTVKVETLSSNQLRIWKIRFQTAKELHGNIYASNTDFPNIGILYPVEAAEAMMLSQTKYWPNFKLDDFLEGIIYEFIKDQLDIKAFVQLLGDKIYERKAIDGAMLRLNLQTIVQPTMESINIRTPFGTVSQTTVPRQNAFKGEVRRKMRLFLERQKAFTTCLEVVYKGLQRIDQTYDSERKMLGWMGYVITRAMAENTSKILKEDPHLLGKSDDSDTQ